MSLRKRFKSQNEDLAGYLRSNTDVGSFLSAERAKVQVEALWTPTVICCDLSAPLNLTVVRGELSVVYLNGSGYRIRAAVDPTFSDKSLQNMVASAGEKRVFWHEGYLYQVNKATCKWSPGNGSFLLPGDFDRKSLPYRILPWGDVIIFCDEDTVWVTQAAHARTAPLSVINQRRNERFVLSAVIYEDQVIIMYTDCSFTMLVKDPRRAGGLQFLEVKSSITQTHIDQAVLGVYKQSLWLLAYVEGKWLARRMMENLYSHRKDTPFLHFLPEIDVAGFTPPGLCNLYSDDRGFYAHTHGARVLHSLSFLELHKIEAQEKYAALHTPSSNSACTVIMKITVASDDLMPVVYAGLLRVLRGSEWFRISLAGVSRESRDTYGEIMNLPVEEANKDSFCRMIAWMHNPCAITTLDLARKLFTVANKYNVTNLLHECLDVIFAACEVRDIFELWSHPLSKTVYAPQMRTMVRQYGGMLLRCHEYREMAIQNPPEALAFSQLVASELEMPYMRHPVIAHTPPSDQPFQTVFLSTTSQNTCKPMYFMRQNSIPVVERSSNQGDFDAQVELLAHNLDRRRRIRASRVLAERTARGNSDIRRFTKPASGSRSVQTPRSGQDLVIPHSTAGAEEPEDDEEEEEPEFVRPSPVQDHPGVTG